MSESNDVVDRKSEEMKMNNYGYNLIDMRFNHDLRTLNGKFGPATCVTFLGLIIFGCSLMQPLSTGG